MRLHTLRLEAFGPFPDRVDVDFDELDQGILLVNGPTGSGKSSLLDAVAFALFGDVPGSRRSLRNALRSHHGRFFPTLGSLVQVALGLTQRAVVIDEIGGDEGSGCVIPPRRGCLPVRHSGHDVVEAGLQVREVARPGLLGAGECGFGTATLLVSIPGSPFRRLDRLRAGCLR